MIFIKLTIGFVLDLVFGDPVWLYHPVRVIGKLISWSERCLRRLFGQSDRGQLLAGGMMAVFVTAVSFFVPVLLLRLAAMVSVVLAFAVETFWIYQILACGCLYKEAMKVHDTLCRGDLKQARVQLSGLVGRDTKELSKEEVICAVVETVAENTADGVIAPMLFILLGGAPLGFAYKAVNTMDSMTGYQSERYRMFGKMPARLDDLVNLVPARISALLMIAASFLAGYDGRGAIRIFVRDRYAHLSPNSAQTESVCAGALGLRLGGTHQYFGQPVEKPYIGDDQEQPQPVHIADACLLLHLTSFLMVFCADVLRFLWWCLLL